MSYYSVALVAAFMLGLSIPYGERQPLPTLGPAHDLQEEDCPMSDIGRIEHNFTHRPPPDQKTVEDYEGIRATLKDAALYIDVHVPDSREKEKAMANLEQAMFWANAGIAREPRSG